MKIELVIQERLKIPTVKRNLSKYGINIESVRDLKRYIEKINKLNVFDYNKVIIELGGAANTEKTKRFINEYEINI